MMRRNDQMRWIWSTLFAYLVTEGAIWDLGALAWMGEGLM